MTSLTSFFRLELRGRVGGALEGEIRSVTCTRRSVRANFHVPFRYST